MCKVSVIVPAYNAMSYIETCLQSLVNQKYHDFEIIVVNDGSTDKTADILFEYQKKYDFINVINQCNKGQALARNEGVKKASGDFICFVDSDDYVSEDFLLALCRKQNESQADIVWCDAFLVKDTIIGKLSDESILQNDEIKHYILNNSGPWRKLIRKSIIIKNDLFFPSLRSYEDVAVVPQYALYANKIVYLEDALYYYVLHEGSLMHQISFNPKLLEIFAAMDILYSGFQRDGFIHDYHDEIEYLFIDHMLHAASLRFFAFDEGLNEMDKIIGTIKERFPKWQNNSYYKMRDWKYKWICKMFYKKMYGVLKIILK